MRVTGQDVTLQLGQYGVAAGLRAGSLLGALRLDGAVGVNVLILDARASRPELPDWKRLPVNPAAHLGLRLSWAAVRRLQLYLGAGLDVLFQRQRFEVNGHKLTELTWTRFTLDAGLRVVFR
jgi:hypothetical protein